MTIIEPIDFIETLHKSEGLLAVYNPYTQSYTFRIHVPPTIPPCPVAFIDIKAVKRSQPLEGARALSYFQPLERVRITLVPHKDFINRHRNSDDGRSRFEELVVEKELPVCGSMSYCPQDGVLYDEPSRGYAIPIYNEAPYKDATEALQALDTVKDRLEVPPAAMQAAEDLLCALNRKEFIKQNKVCLKKELEIITNKLDAAMPAKRNPPLCLN